MARHRSAAAETADIIVPRSPPSSNALRAAAVLPPGEVTSSCNRDQILVFARGVGIIFSANETNFCQGHASEYWIDCMHLRSKRYNAE